MMKYIWNLNYSDFSHMCPYWWLSVFNVIIFVPLFTVKESFKLLGKGLKKIGNIIWTMIEMVEDHFEKMEQDRLQKELDFYVANPDKIKDISDKEYNRLKSAESFNYSLEKMFGNIRWEGFKEQEAIKINVAKAKEQEELRKEFERTAKLLSEREKERILQEKTMREFLEEQRKADIEFERQRIIKNKQRINAILRVVKPILTYSAYTIGSIIVLIVLYYFVTFMMYIGTAFSNIKPETWAKTSHNIKEGSVWVWWILSRLMVLIGLIYVCVKFVKYLKKRITVPTITLPSVKLPSMNIKKHLGFLSIIGNGLHFIFIKPFSMIGKFFTISIQMLKNECPPIKWED